MNPIPTATAAFTRVRRRRRGATAAYALCLLVWTRCAVSSIPDDYGVDCSFPIHHQDLFESRRQRCPPGLAHRVSEFQEYMDGCVAKYSESLCHTKDGDRMQRNRDQPKSMVNFTETGFKHISGTPRLVQLLTDFWRHNEHAAKVELWPKADIHTNHWKVPTEMVSVYDETLVGANETFRQAVLDAAKPVIERWTGMKQSYTSIYGVRIYREGAVLSPHADRLPLVSSAIVNVAQDVDEDWPLEVYGRDGKAYNVTMKPGDVVLYESGSLVHGRPYPLKGRYFANIFIHFEPVGFINGEPFVNKFDADIPPYLVPDSPSAIEHKEWMAGQEEEYEEEEYEEEEEEGEISPSGANLAAANGDVEALRKYAKEDPDALHAADVNGWQPIHEAVRSGHHEAVKLLIAHGADVNARTGTEHVPLAMAYAHHGEDSVMAKILQAAGAVFVGGPARMLRGLASTEIHDEA